MYAHKVVREVALLRGIPVHRVMGRSRHKFIVGVRREIALILRSLGWSYPEIGFAMQRHHSTAMNLCGALRSEEAKERAKAREATRAL